MACAILTALLAVALPAIAENAPMFRGNLRHSGVYDSGGVTALHGIKWKFHMLGEIIASPAVDDTTVYIGSAGGNLYAVDRESGNQKWKFEVKNRIVSSPAVADGAVYFAAYDGYFYAVDAAAGKLKWYFKTAGERRFTARNLHGMGPAGETHPDPWDEFLSSPAVWDGTVYFGSGDGNIYALDASTGALRWRVETGDVVHASPAIADGMVFIGSWDSYFYALDAKSGAIKWRFKTGDDPGTHNHQGIQSSAAVVDGTVYFGCRDAHVYALDEFTGARKWAYAEPNGSWVNNSSAVSHGMVFFANSFGGQVFAADANTGKILYTVGMKEWPIYSSPAVSGDMLYVGSTAGTVNAIDLSTRKIAWSFETDAARKYLPDVSKPDGSSNYFGVFDNGTGFSFYEDTLAAYNKLLEVGPVISSPVVVDHVLYVGSGDGNLYALN